VSERLMPGALKLVPLGEGAVAKATITPAARVDVGAGPGMRVVRELRGGECGIVFDGRGRRPLEVATAAAERLAAAQQWNTELTMYP
jgi:hypothetical protein